MNHEEELRLLEFCQKVKSGFGSISDTVVKKEYERVYESDMTIESLAELLALLEAQNLLDKKHSANKHPNFYRVMKKTLK